MGIFTRVRDIISSNINAMLDKAEDPDKLVVLMIREMEDTLVEIKASCASAMATQKKIDREIAEVNRKVQEWADRAQLAVDKDRDDLAREALLEKKRLQDRAEAIARERDECGTVVANYQADILKIEDKLAVAREKQRVLLQRQRRAEQKKRSEQEIRKMDFSDAVVRFEQYEHRIDQMEAEADLVNMGKKPDLEQEFQDLEGDGDIDNELEALKRNKRTN